jgi:hypothetical protein
MLRQDCVLFENVQLIDETRDATSDGQFASVLVRVTNSAVQI